MLLFADIKKGKTPEQSKVGQSHRAGENTVQETKADKVSNC